MNTVILTDAKVDTDYEFVVGNVPVLAKPFRRATLIGSVGGSPPL
jgi:hypothetical protein